VRGPGSGQPALTKRERHSSNGRNFLRLAVRNNLLAKRPRGGPESSPFGRPIARSETLHYRSGRMSRFNPLLWPKPSMIWCYMIDQPIAAAVSNANTCLRWLAGDTPNLEEAPRGAALRIVNDGRRAAEIISRIRLLFKKGNSQRGSVDVNEVVREMIVVLGGEATRYSISVRTELAADLPQAMGDRVQLQQVLMNLIMNSIDAMKDVDGTRELAIKSLRAENEQLLISVSDTGVGLPEQQADQVFNAFFTTKLKGTGMGLRISRSIVESHGGRLWAADNSPRGAIFHLTLPTKVEAHG
jgi:signal transduction histidine kinase